MCKENFFRTLKIYGCEDDIIAAINEASNWKFTGKNDNCGIIRYHFENVKLKAEVLFENCNLYFRSSNVLPLDTKNFSDPEYEKGFDSSENQAENYKDDVLYKLWKAIEPKIHCEFILSNMD